MLILDHRTLQIKYRVPATEIYKMSLSPFPDDVVVVHVKAVSNKNPVELKSLLLWALLKLLVIYFP